MAIGLLAVAYGYGEQSKLTCLPEGRRAGALLFARHPDYFIVTQNSQPLPVPMAIGAIGTGGKNSTSPDTDGNINKLPSL